jgi:starvation-inducible outer membrane lipoprotein
MIRALVLSVALLLAGCATAPPALPKIETKIVSVPVPVACKPAVSIGRVFVDTDSALDTAVDIFVASQLLLAGRRGRDAYINELEKALEACSG